MSERVKVIFIKRRKSYPRTDFVVSLAKALSVFHGLLQAYPMALSRRKAIDEEFVSIM